MLISPWSFIDRAGPVEVTFGLPRMLAGRLARLTASSPGGKTGGINADTMSLLCLGQSGSSSSR